MSVDFRRHPMFPRGFNNPTRFEADVYDCEVWGKIPSDLEGHFTPRFTASNQGGWVRNPGTRLPGESESYPPDAPAIVEFAMFPTVYDIPYHYANPVSGRP